MRRGYPPPMRPLLHLLALLLLGMALALAGCTNEPSNDDDSAAVDDDDTADDDDAMDDDDAADDDDSAAGTVVGKEGGTVESGDISLEIPAGALTDDVSIAIEVVEDLEAAGYTAAPPWV